MTTPGGDVDLLVETDEYIPRMEHAMLKMELEQMPGLPVDVLIRARNAEASPFVELARLKGTTDWRSAMKKMDCSLKRNIFSVCWRQSSGACFFGCFNELSHLAVIRGVFEQRKDNC